MGKNRGMSQSDHSLVVIGMYFQLNKRKKKKWRGSLQGKEISCQENE